MGDNVYLGDRDAVRTPMQWSRDRNAGFSSANPQQLYLPTIIDPEYHHETVNVESQQQNPSSLLAWMRRIIALRAQHRVFGRGDIEFLLPENAKILAFTRRYEDEVVLVVANLSRFSQSVNLDLHEHRGLVPVELFGGNEFAPIAEGGYNLTLGPYGFYWFSLQAQHHDAHGQAPGPEDLPVISVAEDWRQLFRGRTRARAALSRAWPGFFQRNRWYAGRTRTIRHVEVIDTVPVAIGRGRPAAFIALVQVEYADGEPETYVVPLTVAADVEAEQVASDHPNAGVAWIDVAQWGERLLLFDATADDGFLDAAIHQFKRGRSFDSNSGAELRTSTTPELRRIVTNGSDLTVARTSVEQSNTSAVFGNQVVMKIFRRAQEGVNPDLEIGRFLTERGFAHSAPLVGALEYQKGRAEPRTIGVINRYVPNEGDAWHYTLDALGLFYESAMQTLPDDALEVPDWSGLLEATRQPLPDHAADAIGPYLDSAEMLGRRTAELHEVLSLGDHEEFEPEPFTTLYQRSLYQSMRTQVRPTLSLIRRMLPKVGEAAAARRRVRARQRGRAPRRLRRRSPSPHRRQPHPGARRLPPRSGAPRRSRLRDHRLRGRAVAVAHRAAHQAGRAHRRGRHRPLVPVRGRGRPPRPPGPWPGAARPLRGARDPRSGLADVGHRCLPRGLPRRGRRPFLRADRTRPTPRRCSPPTSSTRRSTRCATTSTTAPTGRRSRCAAWPRCCRASRPDRRAADATGLTPMTHDELVAELFAHASRLGVETGYWDVRGTWHAASVESIVAVLIAMGAPIADLDDASGSLRRHVHELATRVLAPVVTVVGGAPLAFELCLPEGTEPWSARVEVAFEDGGVRVSEVTLADLEVVGGVESDGRRWVRRRVELSPAVLGRDRLEIGYHDARRRAARAASRGDPAGGARPRGPARHQPSGCGACSRRCTRCAPNWVSVPT